MGITNEDRKQVAERLRKRERRDLLGLYACVLGTGSKNNTYRLYERLADLIEPDDRDGSQTRDGSDTTCSPYDMLSDREKWVLSVWPRFENGDPVVIGDIFLDHQRQVKTVRGIGLHGEWDFDLVSDASVDWHSCGERVKAVEEQDSWESIEADAGCTAAKYNRMHGTAFSTKQQVARDIVRRCKALAERGA